MGALYQRWKEGFRQAQDQKGGDGTGEGDTGEKERVEDVEEQLFNLLQYLNLLGMAQQYNMDVKERIEKTCNKIEQLLGV